MKPEKLMEAVAYLDTDLIERAQLHADATRSRSFPRHLMASAACLALVLVTGFSVAYAAGLLDGLFAYFGGNTEPYMELILSAATSAGNDEMEIRVDGAVADEHSCHMVVSFVGLTAETKARFTAGGLDTPAHFDLSAVTKAGELVDFPSRNIATYVEESMLGLQLATKFEDADMTFLISCYVDEDRAFSMSDLDVIRLEYEGLVLELDAENIIVPQQRLMPELPAADSVTDFSISRVGFYFIMPIQKNGDTTFEISLIRRDGTLWRDVREELGYRAVSGGYLYGDTTIAWIGHWGGGSAVSVGLIDLEDFCGAQVNGQNYYFVNE